MKWIWLPDTNESIPDRFEYDGTTWVWNEVDEVYYDILSDENWMQTIPEEVLAALE